MSIDLWDQHNHNPSILHKFTTALQYFIINICSVWPHSWLVSGFQAKKEKNIVCCLDACSGTVCDGNKSLSFIMQVSAMGSDALKDIIERVTSDSQGLHGHAWLDPPKGLSSVHFTFCPRRCGPQGPRGPPGKGWTDGRRHLCVCVWESLAQSAGRLAGLQSASHSDRTSVAWDAARCLSEPGAGVAHRRLHWSEDPCA